MAGSLILLLVLLELLVLLLLMCCRAPVMVALALIELGLPYEDAVDMIRK